MELRTLGSTGLKVSALGLGTVKLGRNRAVNYAGAVPGAEPFPLPTDAQAEGLLRTAAEVGINLIDTAPAYGTSEERLGQIMSRTSWFGSSPSTGRQNWIVCTKAGEEFDTSTAESRFDLSPAHITASVERSLARLGTDYLDIVLLHSDGRDEWIICESGALDALRALKKRGLVRAMGISTKTLDGSLLAMRDTAGACDVVMLPYSPADRSHSLALEAARRRNVGILVKKALAGGRVEQVAAKVPPDIRAAAADPVDAAMRFIFASPAISSVVVGTVSPGHLRHNAGAAAKALGLIPA